MHKLKINIGSANWSKNDACKQTKGNLHTKHTTTWTWKIHHFSPYNMLNVINKKDYTKMAPILKSPKKE
jgi:hypothetical protein